MLSPGFADPVGDAQSLFRTLLTAMAHPGRIHALPLATVEPPAPMSPAAFAIALALADYETPIWLDQTLRTEAIIESLRFHCGAPSAASPADAAFAFVAMPEAAPPLDAFSIGTVEYPDRGATVVLQVHSLANGSGVTFTGPGIRGVQALAVDGLPARFWHEWAENHRQFPRGVDVVFVTTDRIAALPRSVHAEAG